MFFVAIIPSAGDALREADRARTLETKVRTRYGHGALILLILLASSYR